MLPDEPPVPSFDVGVYRLGYDDLRAADPCSPAALAFHQLRAQGLHELFGQQEDAWQVTSWGETDDKARAHEWVGLTLELLGNPQVTGAAGVALAFVGTVIAGAATDAVKDGLKDLIARIWRQTGQQPKFQEVVVDAGNGVVVTCRMAGGHKLSVTVQQPGGGQMIVLPPHQQP